MKDVKAWLEGIGKTIDAKDSAKFASYITEDGIFRFGNAPDVVGRKAIDEYVAAFFTMIKGSQHEVVNYWEGKDSIVWQGKVIYTRHDGRLVPTNFTNIFYMDGDMIKEYLIYIDNAPLFAE